MSIDGKTINYADLPKVAFIDICPKYARKLRRNGGLSYYSQRKVKDSFAHCIVGEARAETSGEYAWGRVAAFLFRAKRCERCKELAMDFGDRVADKEPFDDLVTEKSKGTVQALVDNFKPKTVIVVNSEDADRQNKEDCRS